MNPTLPARLRVALVCIGVGRFQRGFERYFSDLARAMQADVGLTLFVGQADPAQPWQQAPPGLGWLTRLAHRLPVGRVSTEYREYKQDCLAYTLALLPLLRRGGFDVLHTIDPPLAKLVERLAPLAGLRARLVFTNGTAWPVAICPRRAHIQHVQQDSYARALADGDNPARHTLVPCGVSPQRFAVAEPRGALRQRHGIAESTFVVLVVAAIKRVHKRVDHVVDEVAALPGDVLLWIDGRPEDADLVAQAQARLGARCRISHWPSEQVGELYALCDVLVHAALEESFGLALVEAMVSARPVLMHASPHFAWLAGERAGPAQPLLDMTQPGALTQRLAALRAGADAANTPAAVAERAARARLRFDWQHLHSSYLALYQRLATADGRP